MQELEPDPEVASTCRDATGEAMKDAHHRWPFTIAAASDRGSVRERNEDYYGVFDPDEDDLRGRRGMLVVVTDGMGGHFSGGEASRMVVEVMGEAYFEDTDEPAAAALERAFRLANRRVFEHVGNGREGLAGTTCTSMALFPDYCHLAHAGDSRAYRVRQGAIEQLTSDHSFVGELVEKGLLDREDAARHPRRNVLTRAVGLRGEVEPDVSAELPLAGGDSILLCTDGLFSMALEAEIFSIIAGHAPGEACGKLVELAKKNGGEDNITAVVIHRE